MLKYNQNYKEFLKTRKHTCLKYDGKELLSNLEVLK